MPKLNHFHLDQNSFISKNYIENSYLSQINQQENPSSQSSSPKSFYVQSDHEFQSESTSHLSTGFYSI